MFPQLTKPFLTAVVRPVMFGNNLNKKAEQVGGANYPPTFTCITRNNVAKNY
jgi:hypothetical protein